jgi:aryl-alcohol dehydrogenase-like predicted oxidoreductase
MTQRPGPYERFVDDRVFDALDRLAEVAAEQGVEPAAVAFAWVLARVDGAVCGPNRAEHLEPVLAARDLSLGPDELERLEAAFAW